MTSPAACGGKLRMALCTGSSGTPTPPSPFHTHRPKCQESPADGLLSAGRPPSLQPASGQQGGGFGARPRPGPLRIAVPPRKQQCGGAGEGLCGQGVCSGVPAPSPPDSAPDRASSGACGCRVSRVHACHSTDRQARRCPLPSRSGGVCPSKHVLSGHKGGDSSLTSLQYPRSSRMSLMFLYDGGPWP